jgi:hypothetical protein
MCLGHAIRALEARIDVLRLAWLGPYVAVTSRNLPRTRYAGKSD